VTTEVNITQRFGISFDGTPKDFESHMQEAIKQLPEANLPHGNA